MKYIKRLGHFLGDVLAWVFPSTYDAFDPHMGPDAQQIAGFLFSIGVGTAVFSPFILFLDPAVTWLVPVLLAFGLYLLCGVLYASERRRRSPSDWDRSWLSYKVWHIKKIMREYRTGVRDPLTP